MIILITNKLFRGLFVSGRVTDYDSLSLTGNIDTDIKLFKDIFSRDDILRTRRIGVGETDTACALLFMDGMVNTEILGEMVVRPVVNAKVSEIITADYMAHSILYASDLNKTESVADILRGILYGDTVLLLDGSTAALVINTKGWRTRGISEPQNERVLKGPREGFDEAAMLNIAMIRRRLLTPDLCVEMLRIGRRSDTLVFVCYLGTLADKAILSKLKQRLSKIDIDGILDSNYISEYIGDYKGGLLKTIGSTEKPDVVAARLLEGRIALVVDGTPVVLTLPYLFAESFQSDEDYYLGFTVATVGRLLRWLCFFAAVSVPALFVALTTYNLKLLPTHLLLSITELRAGVPMSAVLECIVLVIMFEILKQAGLRMPQSVGQALGIVGGLVVGQAAVEARIISAPMLIAVSFGSIAGLVVPQLQGVVFYVRLLSVVVAAFLGVFGLILLYFLLCIRLFSINSFGADYTEGIGEATFQSLKDTIIRASWRDMIKRPIFNRNIIRNGGYRRW